MKAYIRPDGPQVAGPSLDAEVALARRGLRRTAPRAAILDILRQAATHLSVSELHRRAARLQHSINASTVYRNVAAMTEAGVLPSIDYAGEALFGLAAQPHHHLICTGCGLLIEVPAAEFELVAAYLAARCGFDVNPAGQLLHGHCRQCASIPSG